MEGEVNCKSGGRELVSFPDPMDAAADGLNHRYASVDDVIHSQLCLGTRLGGSGVLQSILPPYVHFEML